MLLVTGCFQYVPVQVSPPPKPQTEVRVTVAEPFDIPMGEFTLNDVTRVEGIVAEANGDTLVLVAKWLHPRVGRKYDALYGSYAIPFAEIKQLERWRFSGKRTVLFLGATGAITAFVLNSVWLVVRGDRPTEVEPPPASVMVPR